MSNLSVNNSKRSLAEESEYQYDCLGDINGIRAGDLRCRRLNGADYFAQRQLITLFGEVEGFHIILVRFHIVSDQRIHKCCSKSDISSLLHLNMEQLTKSLTSLYDLYAINRRSNNGNTNEAEFYSFYVLLQLRCNNQEGNSISLLFRQMEISILQSREMQFVRSVLRHFRMGNYRAFFKSIAAESSYLQFCLLEPAINEVRAQAISCINYSGYKLHPYPLDHLSHILMMKESDLESLCHACGLETCTDEGHTLLLTKQTAFRAPILSQNFSFVFRDVAEVASQ